MRLVVHVKVLSFKLPFPFPLPQQMWDLTETLILTRVGFDYVTPLPYRPPPHKKEVPR